MSLLLADGAEVAAATLTGTGSLAGSAHVIVYAAATLTGTGTLTATATIPGVTRGVIILPHGRTLAVKGHALLFLTATADYSLGLAAEGDEVMAVTMDATAQMAAAVSSAVLVGMQASTGRASAMSSLPQRSRSTLPRRERCRGTQTRQTAPSVLQAGSSTAPTRAMCSSNGRRTPAMPRPRAYSRVRTSLLQGLSR